MHDGVDAAQRVAERERIGEVAERDLDADALVAEPARIAHQAADRRVRRRAAAAAARARRVPVAPVSSSTAGSLPRAASATNAAARTGRRLRKRQRN